MTDKVHGGVAAGEFLTGNMDFFTIATLVPMAQTNVETPVRDLYMQIGYTTWQDVTVVDGTGTPVTYTSEADYTAALELQANYNLLLQIFAQRANPVAISLTTITGQTPSTTSLFTGFQNAATFGSSYSSPQDIYVVKIATEKTILWNVAAGAETNEVGYQFQKALQGVAINDVGGVIAPSNVFETESASACNTIAARAFFL